jgi:hypothetical protein
VSVDSVRAREYLLSLSEAGIGRPSVHKACGVSQRILWEISTGKKAHILSSTESRILAVKPSESMPRGVLVDAEVTRQQIKMLLAGGLTKGALSGRLRNRSRSRHRLRILEGDKVRASSALKVNHLYQITMAEADCCDSFCDTA